MAFDWIQAGLVVAAAGVAYAFLFRERRREPVEEYPTYPDPENKDMTLQELKKYDGRSEEVEKRIYIGICGKIYDVTTRPGFYGPDGPYNIFTGSDATYALARGSLDESDLDLENPPPLKRYEYHQLQDWLGTFARYHIVGNLIDRPPPEVEAVKKPAAKKPAEPQAEATATSTEEATSGDSENKASDEQAEELGEAGAAAAAANESKGEKVGEPEVVADEPKETEGTDSNADAADEGSS